MGKPLSASEETRLLKDTIREAHEATQALWTAISVASKLTPDLVGQFEAAHTREVHLLSNYFQSEMNRQAAELNAAIEQAKEIIKNQIMAGEAIFDRHTSTVTIKFGAGVFDAAIPMPYPEVTTKETDQ